MDGLGDAPPLWPQPPMSALSRSRQPPPPLLSPPVLIVLFPVLALVLLFFAIPSLVSFSSYFFRPLAVKRSWDSLNVLLVFFAILCVIFARRSDEEAPASEEGEKSGARLASADGVYDTTLRRWLEPGDDKVDAYDEPATRSSQSGICRLRRSSSSYPDLKQDSPWETGDDRLRFFDDFEVSKYSSSSAQFDRVSPLRRWRSAIDEDDIKVIPVDTFVLRTPPSPASPLPPPAAKSPAPPPPPPPPPPPVRRTYEAVAPRSTGSRASDGAKFAKIGKAPPAPPPPPPRPPPTPPTACKHAKMEWRKSNAAKEIKMVLASVLNNQRKRKKKQRTRTLNNDAAHRLAPEATSHSAVQPPPPPPPPPPPASVFHSLFRKSSKSKRIHSVPAPPLPPPPPPEPRRRRTLAAAPRPPLPAKPVVSQPGSGSRPPSILMPPPPPPPPFRATEFKFAASGEFVQACSARSSRCSSPELEDAGVPSSPSHGTRADGQDRIVGEPGGPGMYCPSPDVNVKADTFIARLKDGWRLEKINSIREKQSVGGATPPPT